MRNGMRSDASASNCIARGRRVEYATRRSIGTRASKCIPVSDFANRTHRRRRIMVIALCTHTACRNSRQANYFRYGGCCTINIERGVGAPHNYCLYMMAARAYRLHTNEY